MPKIMSLKNTTPLPAQPRYSPYNKNDIKKATGCLKLDVQKGSLGFLQRRITFAEAASFNNVWEGSEGCMKHVKSSFPMPERVVTDEEKKSEGSCDSVININNAVQSSTGSSKSATFNSSTQKNLKPKVSQTLQSSSLSSPSVNNSAVLNSEEEDCVIIEEEKVVIDIEDGEDNSNSVRVKDSQVPSCSSSSGLDNSVTDEFSHWQRLFKLHEDITEAKQRLKKIEIMFQYDQNAGKACAEINLLRRHIIVLINQLRQAKDDIDNGSFNETMSPKAKKKYSELKTLTRSNTSYTSIWGLFKSLCNEFVSVRETWKDTLMVHKVFHNSSPAELQSSIQSIKFNIKT